MDYQELYNHLKSLPRAQANEYYDDLMFKYLQNKKGLNYERSQLVMSKAYDRGHSAGWDECMSYAEEYANFALEILNAQETKYNEKFI